ncbi:hypothetical protein PoB_005656300 [Plakobranchus ocellatus]|uniref:Uncharacterized protein n=1 Tax=Plakobranchus ocellatus TaxID=259542 RepID=A0AAV4CGC7_9GAST|nr:hypothetical protein PoB_005656300 [Plakobranchus ocellatus]
MSFTASILVAMAYADQALVDLTRTYLTSLSWPTVFGTSPHVNVTTTGRELDGSTVSAVFGTSPHVNVTTTGRELDGSTVSAVLELTQNFSQPMPVLSRSTFYYLLSRVDEKFLQVYLNRRLRIISIFEKNNKYLIREDFALHLVETSSLNCKDIHNVFRTSQPHLGDN